MKNDRIKTDSNPPGFREILSGGRSRAASRWFGLLSLVATFLAASAAYGFPSPPGVINASSGNITTAGGTEQGVSVNWEVDGSANNINVGSINTGDITVTGPAGMLTVTSASPSPNANAPALFVYYAVQAPGGSWDHTDNGTYTVSTVGSEVFLEGYGPDDFGAPIIGNIAQSGIASFTVNLPIAPGTEFKSVANGDYWGASNWDLGEVPNARSGGHNPTIQAEHAMTVSNFYEVASASNAVSVLTVNGSLTVTNGELDLGYDTVDYSPRNVDATLVIGPAGHVTFESCWIYDGYGDVPAGITNQVQIDLAPGAQLTSDTTGGGFGMRLWSEWTDSTGDGKTWTKNGIDDGEAATPSYEGILRLLYAEGLLLNNGGQSGNFDSDFIITPGATGADGTLEAKGDPPEGVHVFTGEGSTDFLDDANWLSGSTPFPSAMAAGEIYRVRNAATLGGSALLNGILVIDSGVEMTVSDTGSLSATDAAIRGGGALRINGLLDVGGVAATTIFPTLVLQRFTASDRVLSIASAAELVTAAGVGFISGEALVEGIWQPAVSPLEAESGATVKGAGKIVGSLKVLGRLEPGPESGPGDFTVTGTLFLMPGSATGIKVHGIGTGQFDRILVGHVEMEGLLELDFSSRPLADAGTYPFLVSTSRSASFSGLSISGIGPYRGTNYSPSTPEVFTVTRSPSTSYYYDWAWANSLTNSMNQGPIADPNHDGRPNRWHFAFDTDPLGDGSDEGKLRFRWINTVEGPRFALTVPVRKGMVFSGSPSPVASLLSDDLKYTIRGSGDLQDWTQTAIEYTPADSAGLPALRDIDGDGAPDWEYRTFLLDDDTLPAGFLRALVSEST